MKYKILTIADKDLVDFLNKEHKNGYEPMQWIDKIIPNATSDFVGWRILFSKVKQ